MRETILAQNALNMTAKRQREIVIEFERVRMIRKRAKTNLVFCGGCDAEADHVSLIEAAALFETAHENLIQFIRQNDCHYQVIDDSKTYLCVASLLERMNQKKEIRRLVAKGE